MRKFLAIFMSIALVMVVPLSAVSAPETETIEVYRNQVELEVNGEKVNVDNFLYDGTTYIPLRAVSELLGKYVGWNTLNNTASINNAEYKLEEISQLLPDSKGFKWNYDGFAEYGHTMEIDKIVGKEDSREYIISGEVSDPSGGEGTVDRQLEIKYTIKDNKLIQEKTEEAMMDSKFDKLTLVQTPLVAGTYWEEEVYDKEGNKTELEAHIKKVEINHNLNTEYTIKYNDVNSPYYEIRTIEEGRGVIDFEKLMEFEDSSFPVSYFLYETKG